MPSPAAGGMAYSRARIVVGVVVHGFEVAPVLERNLLAKALCLIVRIVEFAKGVGDFPAGDEELKAIHQIRVLVRCGGPVARPRSDSP